MLVGQLELDEIDNESIDFDKPNLTRFVQTCTLVLIQHY